MRIAFVILVGAVLQSGFLGNVVQAGQRALEAETSSKLAPAKSVAHPSVKVKLGNHWVAFVPPRSCSVNTNSTSEVKLTGPDSQFWMRIRTQAVSGPRSKPELRQDLINSLPKCTIRSEIDRGVGDRNGVLFDLEYSPSAGVSVFERVLCFTSKGTLFQISCTANRNYQEEAWRMFEVVLGTFRISEGDKLDSPVISERL